MALRRRKQKGHGLTPAVSDLPAPHLSSLAKKEQPQQQDSVPKQPSPAERPSTPPPQPRSQPTQQTTPTPTRASTAMRKTSFGDPEADPWASPDLHRGHSHSRYDSLPRQSNGLQGPAASRTTSEFTTTTDVTANAPTQNLPGPTPNVGSVGSEPGWGGFNGASLPSFGGDAIGGGFGAPSSGVVGASNPAGLSRAIGGGRVASHGVEETVTVTAIAEKEGMFMFQHRNYEVTSARRNSKVIRRYSDFVWLLDCLHKRYPFRQLPLLPPKRVASKFASLLC